MIAELSGKQLQKKPARHDNPTLQKRVLDSLVYQYLCDNGCDYTVGVFLPETETTQREVGTEIYKVYVDMPKKVCLIL